MLPPPPRTAFSVPLRSSSGVCFYGPVADFYQTILDDGEGPNFTRRYENFRANFEPVEWQRRTNESETRCSITHPEK